MDKTLILNKIKEAYGFKKNSHFADFLGIKPQTVSSWYSRNTFDYELLYKKCKDINADFIFTGKGEVRKIDNNSELNEDITHYDLKSDNIIEIQKVPLYNIEAMASIVPLFQNSDAVKPIDHISIPNLPKCDGAVYIAGDSMYPLLKSGDIVMYKEVVDIANDIYWGQMYLLSIATNGEEFVMVKYIQKSEKGEKYIKLVSQNKHHQDKDVLISKIRALALVKASIRINTMN